MKTCRLSTLLALVVCFCALSAPAQAQFQPLPLASNEPLGAGTPAPSFTTRTTDGKTLKLSSLRGHVVLIDYWATWCGPCQMATPILQSLYQQYRKQGLVVVGMSLDDETTVKFVKPFMHHFAITYPVTDDPEKNFAAKQSYQTHGIPAQFLIDRKGIIRWSQTGFSYDERQSLSQQIQKLLKERA